MKVLLLLSLLFLTGCASCFTCGLGGDFKREGKREWKEMRGLGADLKRLASNEIRGSKGLGADLKNHFKKDVILPLSIHKDLHSIFCCPSYRH